MINPLQLYTLWGRPIGIWFAGVFLALQAVGHILLSIGGNESYAALVFILIMFLVSLGLLVKRCVSAALYGTSFFIIGLYKATEMFVRVSPIPYILIIIWCAISLLGIAGLLFNRRWFDEKLVRFMGPMK